MIYVLCVYKGWVWLLSGFLLGVGVVFWRFFFGLGSFWGCFSSFFRVYVGGFAVPVCLGPGKNLLG